MTSVYQENPILLEGPISLLLLLLLFYFHGLIIFWGFNWCAFLIPRLYNKTQIIFCRARSKGCTSLPQKDFNAFYFSEKIFLLVNKIMKKLLTSWGWEHADWKACWNRMESLHLGTLGCVEAEWAQSQCPFTIHEGPPSDSHPPIIPQPCSLEWCSPEPWDCTPFPCTYMDIAPLLARATHCCIPILLMEEWRFEEAEQCA